MPDTTTSLHLSESDATWLKDLTQRLIQTGKTQLTLNGRDYVVYQASGSGQYPAFWIRDSVWVSMSHLIPPAHMQDMLQVMALTQNGPDVLQLAHGLSVPAWAIADHIELDGGTPVWFPGVWVGGHDQGNGRYGNVAAQDACYMFIELAHLLAQAMGLQHLLALEVGEIPLLERLTHAFWSPQYDPKTQLATCTLDTRAVAFSDAIIKTGFLLDGSLLRWRAACRLALLMDASGDTAQAARYRKVATTLQRALPKKLWHQTIPHQAGWLYSASDIARQDCVRGTCFALALGILDPKHAQMASRALLDASTPVQLDRHPIGQQLTYQGHIRHLRRGEYWHDTPMPHDSYQNGGYWGMFSGWYLRAIAIADPHAAQHTLALLIAYLRRHNFHDGTQADQRGAPFEWIHPDGRTIGPNYLPNLTLLWRAIDGGFAGNS